MVLRLYNAETGGDMVFADSNTVTVVDGLYSTYIGDDPLSGSLGSAQLANNAVRSNPLAAGAVQSQNIGVGAVDEFSAPDGSSWRGGEYRSAQHLAAGM